MIINLDDERLRRRLEEEAKRSGRTPQDELTYLLKSLWGDCFPEFDGTAVRQQQPLKQRTAQLPRPARPMSKRKRS